MPNVQGLLKKAEPTPQDILAAKFVGRGHIYWSNKIQQQYRREADERRDYERLLEIVACRERQLELAVSLLSQKNRQRVGA